MAFVYNGTVCGACDIIQVFKDVLDKFVLENNVPSGITIFQVEGFVGPAEVCKCANFDLNNPVDVIGHYPLLPTSGLTECSGCSC